jgi:transposase/predicted nucleic acid-binding Zn finger protein
MEATDARQERGLVIANTAKITKRDRGTWIVPSQSGDRKGRYAVTITKEGKFCTCPDFELRQQPCKHVYAVQYLLFRETTTDGTTTTVKETAAVRVTYAQNWPAYNEAQITEKETFLKLLHDLCAYIPEPEQKRGRPRLPLSDMIFAAAFKVYSTASARRFMTDLREAQSKGLITCGPHYNSLFRCLESENVTPIIRELITRAATPLRTVETEFAIDSTGFTSTQLVGLWQEEKYGSHKVRREHDWVKIHAVCGVKTNVVTAIEATEKNTQDSPYFAPLISRTAEQFNVARVMGDKAYSSYADLELTVLKSAEPFIPFKSYAVATSKSETWNRLLGYFMMHREEFLSVYHKRSNAESTFSAIKRVFGDSVRSKTQTAQINEVLLKALAHNIRCVIHAMTELGVSPSFRELADA